MYNINCKTTLCSSWMWTGGVEVYILSFLRKRTSVFLWTGGRGDPRVNLDVTEKRKKSHPWRRSIRDYFVVRPKPSRCTEYVIPDTMVTSQQYPISVCSAKWKFSKIGCRRGVRYQGSGGDYISRILWSVLLIKYYSDDQIKKTEMRGASGTCGEEERWTESYGGETWGI